MLSHSHRGFSPVGDCSKFLNRFNGLDVGEHDRNHDEPDTQRPAGSRRSLSNNADSVVSIVHEHRASIFVLSTVVMGPEIIALNTASNVLLTVVLTALGTFAW